MPYKEYEYGSYKSEIRSLLRKRLTAKDRIRHHQKKVQKWEDKLVFLENEIRDYLKKAKRSVG